MADGLSASAPQSACSTGSDDTENSEQQVAGRTDSINVADFSVRTWKEDLELVIEGQRLYVASVVLGLVSPVFTSLFENKFKDNGPRVIELSDEKYDDFVVFLSCIYPNIMKEISHENLAGMLRFAKKYDVKQLRHKCEQFLIRNIESNETTSKDICTYLNHAARYKLDSVRNKCLEIAVNMPRCDLEEAEKACPLPSDLVVELHGKVMASMDETISTLSRRVEELNAKCNDFEEIAKSFWIGDSRMPEFSEADMGIMTFSIPNAGTFTTYKSPVYKISGKDISCVAVVKDPNVVFQIVVEELPDLHNWSCVLYCKLRILNLNNPKNHCCYSSNATFSAANLTKQIVSTQRQSIISNAGITDDVIHIEIYLLVDSTTHKIKRNV